MGKVKYDFLESLNRIARIVSGNIDSTDRMAETIDVKVEPEIINKKFTLVVAKIDFNFSDKDSEYPERVFAALLGELKEIARGWEQCRMVTVIGNGLMALYETTMKEDVDDIINMVGNMIGIADVVDYQFRAVKKNRVKMEISINYGPICLLNYGDPRCNIIADDELIEENELQFIRSTHNVVISSTIFNNIKDEYKGFFKGGNGFTGEPYSGSIINTGMAKWLENQEKKGG